MKVKIYQLKSFENNYLFMSFDYAKKHGFSLNDYQEVWSGDIPGIETKKYPLEEIFKMFNVSSDESFKLLDSIGFKGHSLSVSDIVEVYGIKWYCDLSTWIRVE